MYEDLVNQILKIIDEDKNQPEWILKFDLANFLKSEISDIQQAAYDEGYDDCKEYNTCY